MGDVFWYALAFIIPFLFLGIIHKFDFYQTGQFRFIVLCLCWGAIVYAPAALANWSLSNIWLISENTVDHLIAPILEELLKGLILLYLVRHSKFTYSVDGALYGFATGIGFAIFENFENIPDAQSIIAIISRIFSSNLVHAFSSATFGITLGIFHSRTSRLRWHIPVIGLLLAIGQHMLFNILIGRKEIHPIIFFIPVFPGMIFIYYIMNLGTKQARIWIKEKLEKDNRVTRGEASVVDRLISIDDILLPVVERFGVEKAKLTEELLYLQARLGIKRKALDYIQDNETVHKNIESDVDDMYTEIGKVQRKIGTYAMLFVRGLFTEEMVSVWERMQVKIRERSVESNGQKGGGLWSSLEERIKLTEEDVGSD